MIHRREYLDKIIPFIDSPFVKILTGVRRCGKSTIMKMIMEEIRLRGVKEEQILDFRLDSMEFVGFTDRELYVLIKDMLIGNKKMYLFLDEVQEISGWERVINSIYTDCDVDIYITGSNSKMMSSEIETYLTGRYLTFRIFTLSFSEYLMFKKAHSDVNHPYVELLNYLRLGGFPATHTVKFTEDQIDTVVRDIYRSTVLSDIVRRNQITKFDQFERVVKFAFDNIGKTFSAKSVSDYLKSQNRKIDNETVYSYLEKLEKAYLMHRCSRYDLKGKEILRTQEKYYLADSSIKYSVLGYQSESVASMLENLVYLELLRRGYSVYIGKYLNKEIDFVAEKQGRHLYIQVCKEIAQAKTEQREYENLLSLRDNHPKYVLTTDMFGGDNYKGIRTMHIADFLLTHDV